MEIKRLTESLIQDRLFKNKAILVLGPRQSGKSTLVRSVVNKTSLSTLWLNADEADVQSRLKNATSTRLKSLVGKNKLVVIDEAQRIENIGLTLKLIIDNIHHVQVIATGSSSFELANKVNEPLTGRKFEFHLYPLSFGEMVQHTSLQDELRLLENRMIYGSYPEVATHPGAEEEIIRLLTDSYLYKDVLAFEQLRKPALLQKILLALALQMSKEVSYYELAQLVGADNQTIERYIDLLEKSFVVFRLSSLSRNLRTEIKKGRKIYFYDNGVRNAILRNYQPLGLRADKDALWENYLISERWKQNEYRQYFPNRYFWRTHEQQEIDYIEEYNGKLSAWEFKWSSKTKARVPKKFTETYPGSNTGIIHSDNMDEWLLEK